MRNAISVAQFRRDVKLAEKRGNDMSKLREVILLLLPAALCRRATGTTLWVALGHTTGIAISSRTGC